MNTPSTPGIETFAYCTPEHLREQSSLIVGVASSLIEHYETLWASATGNGEVDNPPTKLSLPITVPLDEERNVVLPRSDQEAVEKVGGFTHIEKVDDGYEICIEGFTKEGFSIPGICEGAGQVILRVNNVSDPKIFYLSVNGEVSEPVVDLGTQSKFYEAVWRTLNKKLQDAEKLHGELSVS